LVSFLRADYERRGLRSWGRAERSIKHLRPSFGHLPAAAITYARVNDYSDKRRAEGAKPGTIHAEVAALRRMLKLAVGQKRLGSVPVLPSLPASPAREGFLTPEQVDADDLRRSRARVLSRAGVPQSVAMRLLGHKTPNMFLRYDVAATDDLADAVAAAERA